MQAFEPQPLGTAIGLIAPQLLPKNRPAVVMFTVSFLPWWVVVSFILPS